MWPLQGRVMWGEVDSRFCCIRSSSALSPAACMQWWRCSTLSPGSTPSSQCCQAPCWILSAVPLPSWWGCCPALCPSWRSCLWKRSVLSCVIRIHYMNISSLVVQSELAFFVITWGNQPGDQQNITLIATKVKFLQINSHQSKTEMLTLISGLQRSETTAVTWLPVRDMVDPRTSDRPVGRERRMDWDNKYTKQRIKDTSNIPNASSDRVLLSVTHV